MIKRILLLIGIMLFMASCEGLLWTGPPRNVDSETATITITISDPLWDAYLEWLELQE